MIHGRIYLFRWSYNKHHTNSDHKENIASEWGTVEGANYCSTNSFIFDNFYCGKHVLKVRHKFPFTNLRFIPYLLVNIGNSVQTLKLPLMLRAWEALCLLSVLSCRYLTVHPFTEHVRMYLIRWTEEHENNTLDAKHLWTWTTSQKKGERKTKTGNDRVNCVLSIMVKIRSPFFIISFSHSWWNLD